MGLPQGTCGKGASPSNRRPCGKSSRRPACGRGCWRRRALERRHYGLPTGALKRVDYFLAEGSGQPRPQPGEISQALWVEPERALELLSFREDRRLLRKTLERYVKA